MSDALSDISKTDRNKPRYSQIEFENAIAKAREEGAKAERERLLCLSNKDKERIAAAMAVATYYSGIPEVFDVIQLNCKVPKETAASYAKAMLVIMDDYPAWCELIERLSQHTNENISLHSSEQEQPK